MVFWLRAFCFKERGVVLVDLWVLGWLLASDLVGLETLVFWVGYFGYFVDLVVVVA